MKKEDDRSKRHPLGEHNNIQFLSDRKNKCHIKLESYDKKLMYRFIFHFRVLFPV